MFIHEAVKAAISEGKFITRPDAWWGTKEKIKPTNTPDCCICFDRKNEKPPVRGWEPPAEDLMADDWAVVN